MKPDLPFSRASASLVVQTERNLPAVQEIWVQSLGREDPLEKEMATHSVFVKNPYGRRSLVGYSTRGRKQWDMTERLTFSFYCAPAYFV